MGQLKLSPPTVLSPRVVRFLKGVANSNVKVRADDHQPGATEPPLPLTPHRLELIKAYAKNPSHSAEEPIASRIPQHFVPRAQAVAASGDQQFDSQTPLTPLRAFSSGIRTLVAVLILVALLPNLTVGAILWLGVINTPWSRPATLPSSESHTPAVQSAIPPPVLSAPATLEATAGENVTFPLALDGTDGVPARSIIAVSGLPQGSMLSSGRPYGETEWNLKPDEIGDLHLVLPEGAIGESKLIIQLVAPDGDIIGDATTVLKTADPKANIGAYGNKTELAEAHVWDQRAEELGATGEEERLANVDAARGASEDPVPLPTRRPATPIANDNVDANWIKPSAYVNLRKGPSSSSPVVSVVAKGAKLRVVGRKRGWVQVTNPATSHSGWIYAGYIDTGR